MDEKLNPTASADQDELDEMIDSRHAEIKSFDDLEKQRGTPIPALFNQFFKFVQRPDTVSLESYKRMVDTDDTIGSGVDFLTTCLAARMGMYQHPNKEITQYINKHLDQIEGGWMANIKELLSATWAGFAVQEKVWANTDDGFVPKKLVTMPPSTLLFEVERTGEITPDGILQYQRNYNPALSSIGVNYLFGFSASGVVADRQFRPDPYAKLGDFPFPLRTANTYTYMAIRIPRQKCIHYAFDAQGKFGNPYGRSLLRRAYKFYIMKDAFLQMLAIALDRKGTPLTVVYADNNATLIDPNKFNGQNVKGQQVGERADQAARRAFSNVHNDSTIVLPGKKGQTFETDFIQQQSNAGDFNDSIRLCNQGLMRALLLPALVFTGGDGSGSFALGQEHSKTFDKILDGILAGFKQTIIQQLVSEMIRYNFPESAWKKEGFGDFAKRELSPEEREKEMQLVETGVNLGAIDMTDLNDFNFVRDRLGMEPKMTVPTPEEVITDEINDKDKNEADAANADAGDKEPKDDKTKAKKKGLVARILGK